MISEDRDRVFREYLCLVPEEIDYSPKGPQHYKSPTELGLAWLWFGG